MRKGHELWDLCQDAAWFRIPNEIDSVHGLEVSYISLNMAPKKPCRQISRLSRGLYCQLWPNLVHVPWYLLRHFFQSAVGPTSEAAETRCWDGKGMSGACQAKPQNPCHPAALPVSISNICRPMCHVWERESDLEDGPKTQRLISSVCRGHPLPNSFSPSREYQTHQMTWKSGAMA